MKPSLIAAAFGLCSCVFRLTPELVAQSRPYTADQAQQADDEMVVLPTFTIESDTVDRYRAADALSSARVRTQLIETPSSISVIPRVFLEDVVPVRLYEAAKYIAGVQDARGNTFQDRVTIRGFESAGRLVNNFSDTGAHNIDESLIERVEISKGPNAILSPGGNPGGTINIVTKAPEFTAKHSITALVGQYDAQKVSIDTTAPLPDSDRFAYRVIAAYQDTRRYVSSEAKLRTKVIAPQFTWKISPTSELITRYDYLETITFREQFMIIDPEAVGTKAPAPAPGFNWRGTNGAPGWSNLAYQKHSFSLEFNTSFNQYLTMRLAGRFQRARETSEQAAIVVPGLADRYNPYTGIQTPNQTWGLVDPNLDHDEVLNPYVPTDSPYYDPTNIEVRATRNLGSYTNTYSLQNDWVLSVEVPYAKLQTVAGFAWANDKGVGLAGEGALAPLNLFDLASYDPNPTWGSALIADNESKATNWQLYLNQRVTFWEDRIALTGGVLRYDTDGKGRDKLVGGPWNGLAEAKDLFLGSVLVRITPSASVYYSHSTNATPTVVDSVPTWREGKQQEWGAKMEFFNRRLGVNIAYFEIRQTNVVTGNPEYYAGDLTQPPEILTDYGNHGTEFEVTGALTRNLSVVGSVTDLKMRDPRGRRVRSIADRLAGLMLNYHFDEGALKGLSLKLGGNYVGGRAGDLPSGEFTQLGVVRQTSFFVPSQTLLNAGASYEWGGFGVRLIVNNLADKKNYFSGAGGRFSGTGLFTATGRNIRGAFTVKF
ncbi:hypothetical protein AXK12_07415 [Cephaloticoccus capnophilus]|uniref:TonB-dependent receptor plug domain-containing protein n=1 Tax=Cephaloticoccus capnophilus TaxID=1548208 RepID=A0A139SIC2_9BACT|nr:TonB-dependent receptor plug domain-containing protein [Cephaloticoccus capnophilus]KXU34299.1 hypothetical protein AXK12_07415 [Cephaloticoccus capnophilus]